MTADLQQGPLPDALERTAVEDGPYRDALLALLGAHAVPVWGQGQRDAYAALVMEGPSLDHWVRTGNLWAEQERDLWEWEQLVGALGARPEDLLTGAVGAAAERVAAELREWIDLPLLAAHVDGLGEQLVRTLAESSYAPLRRYARTMVMFKRGQAADGITALAEVRTLAQVPADEVAARSEVWAGLARELAAAVVEAEAQAGWVAHGIAAPFNADAALAAVGDRLAQKAEEAR